jgi:Leucine-rich repeat (LRR) protein
MARNNLTEFPEQIKTIPNLTWLSLNDNELRDISFIDNRLGKLEKLYLYSNEIEHFPKEIKYLPHLKELLIFDNQIDSIPDYFSTLTNLEILEIWDNPIKYISPEIKKLQKLRQMRIDDDNLTTQDKENLRSWLPNCTINFQTRADK